jgi:hypothetical protein
MPDHVRVADFEADQAAIDGLLNAINAEQGPPDGVPATAITVLANRGEGKLRVVLFFGSEDDLRKGGEVLDGMTPPEGANMRRTSVENFEMLLNRSL